MVLSNEVIDFIFSQYDDEGSDWTEISEVLEDEYNIDLKPSECKRVYQSIQIAMDQHVSYEEIQTGKAEDLEAPSISFNVDDPKIVSKMKTVQFIDIETSLIEARVFRTGQQDIGLHQLTSGTSILTVAGGSLYDLYTKGEKGIWAKGNHQFKTFANNPLDDTEVLRYVWHILDKASVVIAHNAKFDKGWLFGRFMELGWKLPSKFSLVCTYANLFEGTMTSKKLDYLAKTFAGTGKIKTDFDLWMRCSDGDKKAFEEMLTYNKADIYPTLFQVYLNTCIYYPDKAIDLVDYSFNTPMCKITGEALIKLDKKHLNRETGLMYYLYKNPNNGLVYIDRYNTTSKKANQGLIKIYR